MHLLISHHFSYSSVKENMLCTKILRNPRNLTKFLRANRFSSQFESEESDFFRRVLTRFPPGDSNTGTWPLAFAYGSGVFSQEGNVSKNNMTDFVLVVESDILITPRIKYNKLKYLS